MTREQIHILVIAFGFAAGSCMYVPRSELVGAQVILETEKMEHGKTAALITECVEDLFAVEEHLKECNAVCTQQGAAYREAANLMYRCEQKQCRGNWVPEEQHYQCMSALWSVDEPTAERLEAEHLK